MSDVYQPAYLQDDQGADTYNNPNLTMRQRVGLDPVVTPGVQSPLRVTISPPKNYQPEYLNPPQDTFMPAGPNPQIGTGEAFGVNAANSALFGFGPALAGLEQAGQRNPAAVPAPTAMIGEPFQPGLEDIGSGLAHLSTPEGRAAYEAGRADALKYLQETQQQHPVASTAGIVGGALLTPGFGAGAAGTAAGRAIAGGLGGALGGGLFGVGSATSAGESPAEIAASGGRNALLGGAIGAPLNAVLGPRTVAALNSPGARAAQTAENLGTPLPRGVASDNAAIRGTTAAATSIPFVGARIKNSVEAAREAAGEAIGQSGIDQAIASNRQAIDNLYTSVRNQIDPDRVMPMPQTQRAVDAVRSRRIAARQANPDQGLEQFENIGQQGASFNGAHRARVDARDAGDALSPHPGYNAADYNQITRAMTADIRNNVARQGGPQALNAFDRAERNFGPISEANKFLSRIARQRGPGAGLDEIGFNPATGEFSLNKFTTAWNKINPQARPFVSEPAQRRNIEDIFEMGQHIKRSMRETNTSHTSNVLILWDLARDAVMTGAAVTAGVVSGASVLASGAAAVPAIVFMHWLASPAAASSMANWSRSYRAWRTGVGTAGQAARDTGLKIATRNLANTLGLPVQRVLEHLSGSISGKAETQNSDNQ